VVLQEEKRGRDEMNRSKGKRKDEQANWDIAITSAIYTSSRWRSDTKNGQRKFSDI
jgi:hypothetical protein